MRKLIVVLTALAVTVGFGLTSTAGAGSDKPLRVATSLPAPGFWNGDTPDEIDGGFEYALANEIAEILGYDGIELRNVSFDALVAGKARGFDVAFSQVSITPERKKVVAFSIPYYRSDNGVMVNAGTEVPDAETARGLRWGVQTGTTQVAFLEDELEVEDPPRTYQETTQMFAALQANQVDAVMTDTSILLAQAGQPGSTFEVVGQFETDTGLYGAVFKKGSKLRKRVNNAIKQLDEDGTLAALAEEWLVPEFGGDPAKVPYIDI